VSRPPLRLKAVLGALRVASLIIILGWAGVVAIAYIFSIPVRSPLPRVESAMVTVLAVVLMIAWLASWRALAKAVITRGARRVE
jgi:protein-S-isoprenylcysteine O-methyltransferase Ste14